jgi:hypothetical protein
VSASASATATTVYPLTNQPGPPQAATRPVVAVLVHSGPTTVGLGRADVLYEEFDGTSSFRVIALYQSNTAPIVGPVVDTRPVDENLLSVLDPVVVTTGGPKGFLTQLNLGRLVDASAALHASLFHQPGPVVDTASFVALEHPRAVPPIFSFANINGAIGVQAQAAAGSVTIAVPGYAPQVWIYDTKAMLWRVPAMPWIPPVANLVVQQVTYRTVLLHHPKGQAVQTAKVLGGGRAWVLSAGRLVSCQWRKRGLLGVTDYFGSDGVIVPFRAGRTIVLLAPAATSVKLGSA